MVKPLTTAEAIAIRRQRRESKKLYRAKMRQLRALEKQQATT